MRNRMKRILLSLPLILALCLTGCGKPYGDSISSVLHTDTFGLKTNITLSEPAQEEILAILNNGSWMNDTADCLPEYAFTVSGKTVFYHASCGTFTDAAANRSLPLSKDERAAVNKALGIEEPFSFSLTWNCYGVSSYDSETGKLVKTTDAPNPEDYTAVYELTDDDRAFFKELIDILDIDAYPDEYDPKNGYSKPSMTLILTVRTGDTVKTVTAENIGLSFESDDPKGQAFLFTCETIIKRLTDTDAWKSLPEYFRFYD